MVFSSSTCMLLWPPYLWYSEERGTTPTNLGSAASFIAQLVGWDVEHDNDSEDEDEDFVAAMESIFKFRPDQIQALLNCIRDALLPSCVERPPKNLGEAKHGKLKAHLVPRTRCSEQRIIFGKMGSKDRVVMCRKSLLKNGGKERG